MMIQNFVILLRRLMWNRKLANLQAVFLMW